MFRRVKSDDDSIQNRAMREHADRHTAMAMWKHGPGSNASTTRSFFRVSSELLKNAPSHQTFRCVEPKQSSRDFTDKVERFDDSAIQPKMVVPLVQPGIEQGD